MNKLQILSNQIQDDVKNGEATERIKEKIRKWGVEASKMMDEIEKRERKEYAKDEHIRAEILNNQKEE
ncbi:MAG: hypothetical protein LRZ94_00900 [Candidatus Pacebacteria bacterium]|nr:hypothetical protein [Candidatus Paceibacterota bacterium]